MGVRLWVRAAEGVALDDGLSYAFEQTRIVIGRGAGADVRIPHLTVSERHAVLLPLDTGYAIEDTGSTNGTYVNSARLPAGRRRSLHENDRIRIGAYELSFHSGVLVTEPVTAERTAELARQLFRRSQRGARLPQPQLVVVTGPDVGASVTIPRPPSRLLIGAGEQCQLVLPDPGVEDEHFEITRDLDGVLVRSHAERERDHPGHRLRDGDELLLGQCRLLFEEPAEQPLQALSAQPDSYEPTPTRPAPEPHAQETTRARHGGNPESLPPAPPSTASKPQRPAGLDADLIIYALAVIVMAVSALGLFVLMND